MGRQLLRLPFGGSEVLETCFRSVFWSLRASGLGRKGPYAQPSSNHHSRPESCPERREAKLARPSELRFAKQTKGVANFW